MIYALRIEMKANVGDKVFFLSKNRKRIESGIVERIVIGRADITQNQQLRPIFVEYFIKCSSKNRYDSVKISESEVFASREDAAKFRVKSVRDKFNQTTNTIRNYFGYLTDETLVSALSDDEKKLLKEMKSFYETNLKRR
jgi:hypothetical protein